MNSRKLLQDEIVFESITYPGIRTAVKVCGIAKHINRTLII
jgi:hypothetical protein